MSKKAVNNLYESAKEMYDSYASFLLSYNKFLKIIYENPELTDYEEVINIINLNSDKGHRIDDTTDLITNLVKYTISLGKR
ncbi:MAG: hypothetical protein K5657_10210 [Desulfovibrio sp.]|nr:hypothetical protein [Desulfovibrio sp.]